VTAGPGRGEADAIARSLAADDGTPASPPRSNGELVFDEPWESRAFGVTVALCERGTLGWERFRQGLIAEIGDWERADTAGDRAAWSYYRRWLASLERLLAAEGLVSEEEIARRAAQLEHADAHEHEHSHGHDHGHDHRHHHEHAHPVERGHHDDDDGHAPSRGDGC
jgi:nitrile hydratase accessory protein